jgi:hypothetical protein
LDSVRDDTLAAEPLDPDVRALGRSHLSSPEKILESRVLSTAQKRLLLLQCVEDEMALLVADDEGMSGARPTRIDRARRALRALPA